jgi:CIC family chloride channel protein
VSVENPYLLLIPAVGVIAGVSALAIAYLMSLLHVAFWGAGHDLLAGAVAAPWWRRLLIPTLGGVVVAGMAWLLGRDVRASGTAGLTETLALRGGHISSRQALPSVVAGIVTVSSGGSLGREGPMIELAAAMGSRLGRQFGLNTHQVRVLVCCGAAAAISAVYNAPIGGTIFVMEILIGSFALEIFGPVVIASVISTLIFRGAMGDLPRFVIPAYELVSVWELAGYLVLGVLGGLFSVLTIRCIGGVDELFRKRRTRGPAWTIVGFALVGGIGIAFPHVFGNGAESVNLVLHEELPLYLLLALPVAKLLATAVTRGSGGAGGIFTPTLMMGALVGGAFGYVVHGWFPAHTAEYGAYALVGMGAVLAGTTHAPIMAIMMIFEQTNSYSIILPLMMVCIVSNLVARRIQPDSLHLDALRRRGVILPSGPEAGVMKSLRVADVMHDDVEAVAEREPFGAVVEYFLHTPRNFLYVTDDDRRFVGAIPLHAIKNLLSAGQSLDIVIAADLVEPFECVTPDEFLADTMEKFWTQHAERLPVVRTYDSPRLLGWVSQRDLIGIYSQEILNKRQLLARFTMPGASAAESGRFVELPEGIAIRTLIVPPALGGRTIGGVAPRSVFGVHVLQIARYDASRRKPAIEMPGPGSVLHAHDRLVVIGLCEDVERLQRTLDLEAEE